MTGEFIRQGKNGDTVYITNVRNAYKGLKKEDRQTIYLVLQLLEGDAERAFELDIPGLGRVNEEEKYFIETYIWAEIYNILSSLGGKHMTVYINTGDMQLKKIAGQLKQVFGIDKCRAERKGYGRCINVIDRMLDSICKDSFIKEERKFEFIIKDISEMPATDIIIPRHISDSEVFGKVTRNLEGRVICGMDVGGTDIKVAMVVDGRIACLKEYDWFPANFRFSSQLIEPVCMLVRLVRANISIQNIKNQAEKQSLEQEMKMAFKNNASFEFIRSVVEKAESFIGHNLIEIDAIGLCFPDVVVKDKIVGGEVYKTRGIRNNPDVNYEVEFSKLTNLNELLGKLCKPEGVVKITNDGPMAAFTAAVETAASASADAVRQGIFAHTLGTELGTGWVDGDGKIPEIPLEVYNFIIDLGSFTGRQYEPDDLRSVNNFNTGLPGTLQKYTCQSGVFRLALKYFTTRRPDLYKEMLDRGLVVEKEVNRQKGLYVPTEPVDMRKPLLEFLMSLPERENDEMCRKIFTDIGEYLAITWHETEWILHPEAKSRILFGRMVKNNFCFELMKVGAKAVKCDILLEAADGGIANTSLMKQLEADMHFTVAQFAQAIGAVYYGNMGLQEKG